MVVCFNSPNKNECILSFDGVRLKIVGTEFKILHMRQKFSLQKRKKKKYRNYEFCFPLKQLIRTDSRCVSVFC